MKRKKILSLLLTLLFLTTLLTAVTVPAGAATISKSTISLRSEKYTINDNTCSGVNTFNLFFGSTLTIGKDGVVILTNGTEGSCTFQWHGGSIINLHGTLTANAETKFCTSDDGNDITYNVYLDDGAVLGSTVPTDAEGVHVNYYGFTPTSADTNMGTVSYASYDYYVMKGGVYDVAATANEGYEFVNWTDENGTVVSTQAECDAKVPALTKDSKLTANFKKAAPATHTSYAAFTAVDSSKYGNYKVRFTFQNRNTLTTSKTLSELFPDCEGSLTFNCNISDIPAEDELTSAVLVH